MIQKTIKLLGHRAKDRVTGFSGVITSVCFDLYGCVQAAITPAANAEGNKSETGMWFDVCRLDVAPGRVMPVPDFERVIGAEPPKPETYRKGPAEKAPPR